MKRLLLVTMLLTLSFSTSAEPVSGKWNLEVDDFSTIYWHEWSEGGVLIRLSRSARCGNWSFGVGAGRGKDSTGNESLMARINRLPIHEVDSEKDGGSSGLALVVSLSDEENASIREGGNIYIKYGNKATLEVPLDVASKHMAEIDRACDKEKEVWD